MKVVGEKDNKTEKVLFFFFFCFIFIGTYRFYFFQQKHNFDQDIGGSAVDADEQVNDINIEKVCI